MRRPSGHVLRLRRRGWIDRSCDLGRIGRSRDRGRIGRLRDRGWLVGCAGDGGAGGGGTVGGTGGAAHVGAPKPSICSGGQSGSMSRSGMPCWPGTCTRSALSSTTVSSPFLLTRIGPVADPGLRCAGRLRSGRPDRPGTRLGPPGPLARQLPSHTVVQIRASCCGPDRAAVRRPVAGPAPSGGRPGRSGGDWAVARTAAPSGGAPRATVRHRPRRRRGGSWYRRPAR